MATTEELDMALSEVIKNRKPNNKGKAGGKRVSVKGRGTVQAGAGKRKAKAATQQGRSAMRSDDIMQRRGLSPAAGSKRQARTSPSIIARTSARSLTRRAIHRQQTVMPRRNQTPQQVKRGRQQQQQPSSLLASRSSPLKISLGTGNSRSITRPGGGGGRAAGRATSSHLQKKVSVLTQKLQQLRSSSRRPNALLSQRSSLVNRRNERRQQTSNVRTSRIDSLRGFASPTIAPNPTRRARQTASSSILSSLPRLNKNNNNNNRNNRGNSQANNNSGRMTLDAMFRRSAPHNNNNNNRGGRNNNSNNNNNRGGGKPKLVLGSGNANGRGRGGRGGRN